MEIIDLGGSRLDDQQDWWLHYLAWCASTPRNWIECNLEPPRQNPKDRIRPIDLWTPEELGVAKGYPTAGKSVWWIIMCLDGAPERVNHLLSGSARLSPHNARLLLASAETRFRSIVAQTVHRYPYHPTFQVLGPWSDGVILAYEAAEWAAAVFHEVRAACLSINDAESLPWTQQFHNRGGMGLTVHDAFSGLVAAPRDMLISVTYSEKSRSQNAIDPITTSA